MYKQILLDQEVGGARPEAATAGTSPQFSLLLFVVFVCVAVIYFYVALSSDSWPLYYQLMAKDSITLASYPKQALGKRRPGNASAYAQSPY